MKIQQGGEKLNSEFEVLKKKKSLGNEKLKQKTTLIDLTRQKKSSKMEGEVDKMHIQTSVKKNQMSRSTVFSELGV